MRRFLIPLALVSLIFAGAGCTSSTNVSTNTAAAMPAMSQATILVPQDETGYEQAVDTSGGDPKSVAGFAFVKKTISYPTGTNEEQGVAQAAASELSDAAPAGAEDIVYFKVVNGTAYVLMQMDVDAWAGVSFALAKVDPLVEKSLLQYSDIKTVDFTVAPGDNIDDVTNKVMNQEDSGNSAATSSATD